MTDPTQLPPPDDPLDLAASAVVDGTATDAERALVESTPEGRARVREFRSVAAAVGTAPPAQDESEADAAIAAALGAVGSVAVLTRQRRQLRWLAPVAAVAAVIVVALGIGSLVTRDSGDAKDTSALSEFAASTTAADAFLGESAPPTAAADATSGAAAGGGGAAEAPAAPVLGATTTFPASSGAVIDGGELGAVNDPDVLAAHAKSAIEGEQANPGSTPRAGAPPSDIGACDQAARQRSNNLGALRYRATVTYSEAPALVLVYDATDGASPPHILEVVARADCRRLTLLRF